MGILHFIDAAVVLAFLTCSPGYAQLCSLHGKVMDAESGEPMEFVNVFLANTTSGTSTDARGVFALSEIPPGDYDIVVSRVGYLRATKQITLAPDTILTFPFELMRKVLQADEVEVIGSDPSEWHRLLEQFTKEFLGETPNASHCRILNPFHLNLRFEEESRTLIARCDTILLVKNDALGYLIAIEIEQFEWEPEKGIVRYSLYPRFEELPHTPDDSLEWEWRRQETYKGSMRHFLASLVAGVTAGEMFAVYSGDVDQLSHGQGQYVSREEIDVTPDSSPGVFRLAFSGWLRIEYWGRIPPSRSLLTLKAPYVRMNREGIVLTRLGTMSIGDWSRSRIADLLPLH